MINRIKIKMGLQPDSAADQRYLECVGTLLADERVLRLKEYEHHGTMDRLEHSLYVSYLSFLICRRFGLDDRAAARGGLLHDFFLYDRRVDNPHRGLHGIMHPRIALQTASGHFDLNERERDIIARHMWPLTITPPKYRESYVVMAADKCCAVMEVSRFGKKQTLNRALGLCAV